MTISSNSRPSIREAFVAAEKRLDVHFHTSSEAKFLQARLVFESFGLLLRHFVRDTEPYNEDYSAGKDILLARAIEEIAARVGRHALFFVEDTSLRIDALSEGGRDFPGLSVKEWFGNTQFSQLDQELLSRQNVRTACVKSDIALHIPGVKRPVYFHGESVGHIAESPPTFDASPQHPWLTPATFNGWFVPDGASRRLGEMSFDESWTHDFRVKALLQLLERLEEYASVLNLPVAAFTRKRRSRGAPERTLFAIHPPTVVVVGRTCAGKTTFGRRASQRHGMLHVDASNVLRTLKEQFGETERDSTEFAEDLLRTQGADIVARKLLELFADDATNGLVITGFRTIEELDTIKSQFPDASVVLIDSTERTRFERYLRRARDRGIVTLQEFAEHDQRQWSFGLLRVAETFADVKVVNELSEVDYLEQIDSVLSLETRPPVKGVTTHLAPKHPKETDQLYRCLAVLCQHARAMSSAEISKKASLVGRLIHENNVRRALRSVPELAERLELSKRNVHYQIRPAGRAYVQLMERRSRERGRDS